MRNTKIWLPIILSTASFVSTADEASIEQVIDTQGSNIQVSTVCNNWSLNCLLDKIVSGSSASLLGPGVSGDPS